MNAELRAIAEKSMIVIETDGTVHYGVRSVLFTHRALGWRWFAALFWYAPLRWPAEVGYWFLTRNRMLFSRFMFTTE